MELRIQINRVEEVSAALTTIEAYSHGLQISRRSLHHLLLIADEFLSNLFNHAQQSLDIQVEIQLTRIANHWRLEIEDNTWAFDFTTIPIVFSTSEIERRKVGGLGIPLIRSLVDNVSYQRVQDKNRTIFLIAQ
ncbi:ATP-binding protein [Flavobacterium sp. JP2137]|uniref:ATP-binding protein n=1 Tax=Flavobacterium sp. JP2137 TaxID=3414510 RepID=UPI003D2FB210